MAEWHTAVLRRIAETDDLHIIDEAYRVKYRGSPYLEPMIGGRARSATVKVLPRASHAGTASGHRGGS